MTESSRTTTDAPGNAELLLQALRSAAPDDTREALGELADRARRIVEELARSARGRMQTAGEGAGARPVAPEDPSVAAWNAPGSGGAAADQGPFPSLHRRLEELRTCVGEVADVLEATVERLETVELQLGDPDVAVERKLADGIERCQQVLMGIEHRVRPASAAQVREATAQAPGEQPAVTVLVVAASSHRRAQLCIALEKHGLRTLAASDPAAAWRIVSLAAPPIALLVLEGPRDARADLLDEWKQSQARGMLPAAAVLESGDDDPADEIDAASFAFATIRENHGAAAMAASLVRLSRAAREDAANAG